MNKAYTCLILFVIIGAKGVFAHPVHVSVCSVEIYPELNEVQVLIKVFKNDMELALFHNYQIKVDYISEDSVDLNYNYIKKYIKEHFSLESNKVINYVLNGVEFDSDIVWLNYTINLRRIPTKFIIVNTIFNDIYFDQKNLMIIKCNNYEKGFELDYNNTTFELNIKEIEK